MPCQSFVCARLFTLACMPSRLLGGRKRSSILDALLCRVANEFRAMRGRSRVEAMQLDLSSFR